MVVGDRRDAERKVVGDRKKVVRVKRAELPEE